MAQPRVHLAVATVALLALRRRLHWADCCALLATGVLVDADHLIDYALYRWSGRRRWVVTPLHGWEYAAALLLAAPRLPWPGVARAAALGLLLHLILDQVTNRPAHPALYSLFFRWRRRFAAERLADGQDAAGWMTRSWRTWL